MKTPGPPPTPTNLKLLRGNPGKRKLSTNEPDPPPAIPTCPSHLDKVAKREWRRISKELFEMGIISKLDRAALGAYCDAYGRWAESAKQIQQYGDDIQIAQRLPNAVAVSADSSYGARPNARVPDGVRTLSRIALAGQSGQSQAA